MSVRDRNSFGWRLFDGARILLGALALTLTFFLVLPLIQAISKTKDDVMLRTADSVVLPPPPPPPPDEQPEEEPEPEEEPPKLMEESPPLDLAQLELALNPGGFGDGWMSGDFGVDFGSIVGGADAKEALFSMADLDQAPRATYQANPTLSATLRKRAPGKAVIKFIVNDRGRVESPLVASSTDPVFDAAAIAAVKKWRFEPGKRKGQAVRFRMRVTVTFPKG